MNLETCEICGNTFIRGYGYSLVASWNTTGHHAVPAFICPIKPSGQHFGCSPAHAMMAFMNCLQNHMSVEQLLNLHAATGKPRYLPEHASWAKQLGENFHIVTIRKSDGSDINKI